MTHFSRQEIRDRIVSKPPLVRETAAVGSGEFEEQLQPDSIDLRIGTVAYAGRKRISEQELTWELPPGEMAILVTAETVQIPVDVAAEVSARQSVLGDGFLVLAASHVDPGYTGPLTARIINLLPVPNPLAYGSPMLTVTFYKLDRASDRPVLVAVSMEEKVQRALRESRDTFHRLFVRPEDLVLRKELRTAAVIQALTWLALAVPAIAVVSPFSISFFWKTGLELSTKHPEFMWAVLAVAALVLVPLLALYMKVVIRLLWRF